MIMRAANAAQMGSGFRGDRPKIPSAVGDHLELGLAWHPWDRRVQVTVAMTRLPQWPLSNSSLH